MMAVPRKPWMTHWTRSAGAREPILTGSRPILSILTYCCPDHICNCGLSCTRRARSIMSLAQPSNCFFMVNGTIPPAVFDTGYLTQRMNGDLSKRPIRYRGLRCHEPGRLRNNLFDDGILQRVVRARSRDRYGRS